MLSQNVALHRLSVASFFFFFFFFLFFIRSVVCDSSETSRLMIKHILYSLESIQARITCASVGFYSYDTHPIWYHVISVSQMCDLYVHPLVKRTKEKNVYSRFSCFIVRRSPSTSHSPFADVTWLLVFRYRYIMFPGNQCTYDIWYHIWNNFSFRSSVINFSKSHWENDRISERAIRWYRT